MSNHIYPKTKHRWKDKHNNRWHSLGLHIAIETVLDIVSKPASIYYRYTHNILVYKLLKLPFNIIYGFNCGFKTKNISLHLISDLRSKKIN